jgi:hypothetical protein
MDPPTERVKKDPAGAIQQPPSASPRGHRLASSSSSKLRRRGSSHGALSSLDGRSTPSMRRNRPSWNDGGINGENGSYHSHQHQRQDSSSHDSLHQSQSVGSMSSADRRRRGQEMGRCQQQQQQQQQQPNQYDQYYEDNYSYGGRSRGKGSIHRFPMERIPSQSADPYSDVDDSQPSPHRLPSRRVDSRSHQGVGGSHHHSDCQNHSVHPYHGHPNQSPLHGRHGSWGTHESFNRNQLVNEQRTNSSANRGGGDLSPPFPPQQQMQYDDRLQSHYQSEQYNNFTGDRPPPRMAVDSRSVPTATSTSRYRCDNSEDDGSNSYNSNSISRNRRANLSSGDDHDGACAASSSNSVLLSLLLDESNGRGQPLLHSSPSSNSLRRANRRSYHDEEDDYAIGRGIRSMGSSQSLRHHRSDDDTSAYDDIFDDESRGGREGGDTWSVGKSVFPTLPDRLRRLSRGRAGTEDGSLFDGDDEVGSVLSASSCGTSYSSRHHRTASRSNSVHSQMSQLSQRSSQPSQGSRRRGSKRQIPRSSELYDSGDDDSMESLLNDFARGGNEGGGGILSAVDSTSISSGSYFSERGQRRSVGGSKQRDPSPTHEELAAGLGDTLLRLESLDLGIDLVDAKYGCRDGDELSIKLDEDIVQLSLNEVEYSIEESAWWIQELEDEGVFEYDTTTVYSNKMPPRKQIGVCEGMGNNLVEALADAGVLEENDPDVKVDNSDTSTLGMEDDGVGDWEERLWSLARTHYLEYSGSTSEIKDDATGISKTDNLRMTDEQSVIEREKLYHEDYVSEKDGVLMFRSLLFKCIEAYVGAFHCNVEGKQSTKETEGNAIEPKDGEWTDHAISFDVNQYIPLVTARALFVEVIKMSDAESGTHSLEGRNESDGATSVDQRADLVTTILTEDCIGIFRRYKVLTVQTSAKISVGGAKRSRKLLDASLQASGGTQTELESYLYGEMYAEGEKKNEDQDGLYVVDDVPVESEEHEIRIRSSVVATVRDKHSMSDTCNTIVSWPDMLASTVLLPGVQHAVNSGTEGEYSQIPEICTNVCA